MPRNELPWSLSGTYVRCHIIAVYMFNPANLLIPTFFNEQTDRSGTNLLRAWGNHLASVFF